MANVHTPELEIIIDWERWHSVQSDIEYKCFGWQEYSPDRRPHDYHLYFDNRPSFQRLVHLSRFENLPLEMLHLICRQADLDTLLAMRHVNTRLRMVIDHMLEFNRVAKHFPQLIIAFQELGVAKWHNIGQIYAALNSQRCVECGQYGDIIYALTCRRICYECQLTEKYYPLSAGEVQETYCLSQTQLRGIPCLKSVKGYYGRPTGLLDLPMWFVYSCNLYDRTQVLETAAAVHGSVAAAMDKAAARFQARVNRYEQRCTRLTDAGQPELAEALRRPRRRVKTGSRSRLQPERYMATIRAPMLDFISGSHIIGFCCPACSERSMEEKDRRLYTNETFAQHLESKGVLMPAGHVWGHKGSVFDRRAELPRSLPQSELDLFYDMEADWPHHWDKNMSLPLWVGALYANLRECIPNYIPHWAHDLYGHLGLSQEEYASYMGASNSVDAMDLS